MAKRLTLRTLIILAVFLISGCAQYEKAAEKLEWLEPDTFTCDVMQVNSGERFMCRLTNMEIQTVRLAGISITADKSARAKRFSESVLKRGTLVNIEPAETKRERADINAYVFVPGGKMLNMLLLEKGYAEVARDDIGVKYKAAFIKIEEKNSGEENEIIEEVETEKAPWLK